MDRKMEKKSVELVALGDEELGAVSGAGDIFSLGSPVTVTQVNVSTPTAVVLGNLGAVSIAQGSVQSNSSSVSYSH
jgi:hypothetical protein